METTDFKEVKSLFITKKQILITSHSNPDGDALGSALALFHFFKQSGHEVRVMMPNAYPDFLNWLPGSKNIIFFEDNEEECISLFNSAEIIFSLDYNSPSRIGKAAEYLENANGTKILIDHHLEPLKEAFNHCFSTVKTSSTCELVFQFMTAIDAGSLNKDIAECIYVGIMTDTGSFSYNCNYVTTFLIVSELISLGIDISRISRLIYSNKREEQLRLLGFSLSEKLTVIPEYHTAFIALTRKDMYRYDYKTGDTEGLVNYALSIKGIKLAALFTERKDKIRISFRSAGDFSVNEFARKHYVGGGHKNAAGGDSFEEMDQTIERFKHLLKEYAEYLK